LRVKKLLAVGLFCIFCLALSNSTTKAQSKSSVDINPDSGKMGSYRALAQLAYRAYEQKDDKTAAILGRVLERVWDRGEGELRKSSPDVWGKIDQSMDGFIKPLTGFASAGRADEAKERAAYQAYLDSLSVAE
jgi:hypothetical protein